MGPDKFGLTFLTALVTGWLTVELFKAGQDWASFCVFSCGALVVGIVLITHRP